MFCGDCIVNARKDNVLDLFLATTRFQKSTLRQSDTDSALEIIRIFPKGDW